MDFKKIYKQKLVTADEAVKVIESGDWVDFGWCTNTVDALDAALARRTDELFDVNIRGGVILKPLKTFERADAGEHFTWNSWHMTGVDRKYISRGLSYYTPIRYSELPGLYREPGFKNDVAMFQVAPIDSHGHFNFGPNASHLSAMCESAKKVIVEVNQNMPRCLGGANCSVHINDVDLIVEGDNPPIAEMGGAGESTEVDKAIAQLIVDEIPNGACLQLGIGGMPNAVGSLIAESDLKNLGVHTEMYVDAFVDLTEAGRINGRKKQVDKGLQTYAFGAGSKRLYEFMDNNAELLNASSEYTNDIHVISSIDNLISINNAVDVDLFGQINAESAGIKHISGSGGQQDFVLGAYLSRGGKSFICLSSTYKDAAGEIHSRINPTLTHGSVVTTTRANIHYLVTEYGKVNLKGLSTWQRAEAIISLAHPDFRDQLIEDAEEMKIWRRSNKR